MLRVNTGMGLLVALMVSFAQLVTAEPWIEGKHYSRLPIAMPTSDPSKIEVEEIFWYGCPHCYEFNNVYLPGWEKNLPEDVNFVMTPATFPGWVNHAKAFYAAQFLGEWERLHQPIFDAIVANPKKYKTEGDLKDLFTANGVDGEAFDKLFTTGGFRKVSRIEEAIAKAEKKVRAYRITGVPALVVNGKYKIGVREAGGLANLTKVANYLIELERKQALK